MSKKPRKLKVKKPSWWEEFKNFAIKGNAMALAVGTIIGAAFKTITDSLTKDIIMPVINIFLGGAKFEDLKIELPRMPWVDPTFGDTGKVDELGDPIMEEVKNYLTWGNFLSAIINFFILALVVFFFVKFLNKLTELGKKKDEEAAAEPEAPAEPEPTKEELLLAEIRDLLKAKEADKQD